MVSSLSEKDRSYLKGLYEKRFEELGYSIKTVGWGKVEDQILRFDVLLRNLDLKGKTILDVGCGLGDLVPYLRKRVGDDFHYIGIDVAEKFIEYDRQHLASKNVEFFVGDVFDAPVEKVDITLLSGTLNLKIANNMEYTAKVMEHMFKLSKDAACLNFLTKYVDFELDKDFHYRPEEVFPLARKLTKWVSLYHDYPLWEFTVQLRTRSY